MANTRVYIVPSGNTQRSGYPAGDWVTVNAPGSFSVTITGQTAAFSWTDTNSGGAETVIYSANASGGPFAIFATKSAGVVTHSQTLLPGTYWFFAVAKIGTVTSSVTSTISRTVENPFSGLAVGQTVTITGSGFGAGVVPLKFEDFETGVVGESLSTLGFQVDTSNGPNPTNRAPYITDTDKFSGTRCGTADCSTGGDCGAYLSGIDAEEIYVTAWVKPVLLSDPDTSANWGSGDRIDTTKGIRAHADNGPNLYTSYPGFMTQEPFDVSEINYPRIQYNHSTDSSGFTSAQVRGHSGLPNNQWTRQQIHYRMSTPGVANGFMRYWHNKVREVNLENIPTRSAGVTSRLHYVLMPFYWGNGVFGHWLYDNVCIHVGDNAAARVELGDDAVYENCTQVPEVLETVSWSDGEIIARLRTHNYGAGTAWLHVINANNVPVKSIQVTLS